MILELHQKRDRTYLVGELKFCEWKVREGNPHFCSLKRWIGAATNVPKILLFYQSLP
jgi:hypothetical protein